LSPDPTNNVACEEHCYFDHDHSGHYALDYETESARDPHLEGRGVARVSPLVGWCQVNGVRGFLGEYGVPRDDPRWQRVLAGFLEALDRAGMDSCARAAGEWCGDDRLAVTPSSWNR
jgi:endoglucanase